VIVGLEPNTSYSLRVMAYNSAGDGPESSENCTEKTYRKAPQKPPSSVKIHGTKVVWRYGNGTALPDEEPLEGYKIRVWEADDFSMKASDVVSVSANIFEGIVANVKPGMYPFC